MIFIIIIIAALFLLMLGFVFSYIHFQKIFVNEGNKEYYTTHKWKKRLITLAFFIPFIVYIALDFVNGVIVSLHVVVIWALIELIFRIVKKAAKVSYKSFIPAIVSFTIAIIYLSIGWYNAHHVIETDYSLTTDKDLGTDSLRIVQISDSHV